MKKHTQPSKMAYIISLLFLPVMLSVSPSVSGQIQVAPFPITEGTFGSPFSHINMQTPQNYANYYGRSIQDY
jgi:hypothetical protein